MMQSRGSFVVLLLTTSLFLGISYGDSFCPCSLSPDQSCSWSHPAEEERGHQEVLRRYLELHTSNETKREEEEVDESVLVMGTDGPEPPQFSCGTCVSIAEMLKTSVATCCGDCDNYTCDCNGISHFCFMYFRHFPTKLA